MKPCCIGNVSDYPTVAEFIPDIDTAATYKLEFFFSDVKGRTLVAHLHQDPENRAYNFTDLSHLDGAAYVDAMQQNDKLISMEMKGSEITTAAYNGEITFEFNIGQGIYAGYKPQIELDEIVVSKIIRNSTVPLAQRSDRAYSFGFQGMMRDDEVSGSGNSYTTYFRQYDPRLGHWFSHEPKPVAWESPYAANRNNPILFNDPMGDCPDGNCDTYKNPEGDNITIPKGSEAKVIEGKLTGFNLRDEKGHLRAYGWNNKTNSYTSYYDNSEYDDGGFFLGMWNKGAEIGNSIGDFFATNAWESNWWKQKGDEIAQGAAYLDGVLGGGSRSSSASIQTDATDRIKDMRYNSAYQWGEFTTSTAIDFLGTKGLTKLRLIKSPVYVGLGIGRLEATKMYIPKIAVGGSVRWGNIFGMDLHTLGAGYGTLRKFVPTWHAHIGIKGKFKFKNHVSIPRLVYNTFKERKLTIGTLQRSKLQKK